MSVDTVTFSVTILTHKYNQLHLEAQLHLAVPHNQNSPLNLTANISFQFLPLLNILIDLEESKQE
jgi:hypothetical protein